MVNKVWRPPAKGTFLASQTLRSSPANPSLLVLDLSPCAAHQEGRNHRQVRCALRCLAAEAGQEDGGEPAQQVHVRLLRQGQRQALGGRHLGLRRVQEDGGRRRVHSVDGTGGAGSVYHPSLARRHRPVSPQTAALGGMRHDVVLLASLLFAMSRV